MTLPSFLLIGAMKAGTTTLYADLARHPEIFLPEQKEPETLTRFTDPESIRSDYRSLLRRARLGQICGEASTAYTKRPVFEGVADRALEILGPNLRLIYLRRNPLSRIISQYRHDVQQRRTSLPFSQALREKPEYIDFSRYDWQLAPWRACFGDASILDLSLETYAATREKTVRRVLQHIGVDPRRLSGLDATQIVNSASEMKQIDNPLLNTLIRSKAYQRGIKPLIARSLRGRARQAILARPLEVPVVVTDQDRVYIEERLATRTGVV